MTVPSWSGGGVATPSSSSRLIYRHVRRCAFPKKKSLHPSEYLLGARKRNPESTNRNSGGPIKTRLRLITPVRSGRFYSVHVHVCVCVTVHISWYGVLSKRDGDLSRNWRHFYCELDGSLQGDWRCRRHGRNVCSRHVQGAIPQARFPRRDGSASGIPAA